MSIFLTKQKIIKDWTDYNGHMNVAYYVLIFDQFGSEVLLTNFDMGERSAKTTKKSTMVVESHITYDQEVKEGDEVDVNLIYCDHDKKRIQYKLEMIHAEKTAQETADYPIDSARLFLNQIRLILDKEEPDYIN